jgi:S1-C subfamily serine protease
MTAELVVLTGAKTGVRLTLGKRDLTIGRSPEADLQFDPSQELAVSGSHASVFPSEGGWSIRDLDSLNGTWVNGQRITSPVSLADGDRIQFGGNGPVVEFSLPKQQPARAPGENRRVPLRLWTAIAVSSGILFGVGLMGLHSKRQEERYRDQAREMQERIDSILDASAATEAALEGRIQGFHQALVESRENLQSLRGELDAASQDGDSDEIQSLRIQLQDAQAALLRQQLAANLDFEGIEAKNRRAVAKVFVDFGDEMHTATAFSVRPDATLITSRHVVLGPSGTRTPRRLAVQFADSRQVWPARLVGTSNVDDLAALKVDNIVGNVPTTAGFNTNVGALRGGQGVALIGFPLGGGEVPGGEGGSLALTTLTAGIVSTVTPEVLEFNGYGVEGSSGSPVFDDAGLVVGVLFGGRIEDGERTLFAVPADRVVAFLSQVR